MYAETAQGGDDAVIVPTLAAFNDKDMVSTTIEMNLRNRLLGVKVAKAAQNAKIEAEKDGASEKSAVES